MGKIEIYENIYSPLEKLNRKLRVYTPDSYAFSPDKHYPVLYMTDAQNIYSDYRSARYDTWCVNPTLERLFTSGELQREWIVCGIDHTIDRFGEYSPWPCAAMNVQEPKGAQFCETLCSLVMPWMHEHYRILDGAANTALAGSSLGGLISLFCGHERPDKIGRIGAFSPSLTWSEGKTFEHWSAPSSAEQKIYLDMGSLERLHRDGQEIDATLVTRKLYDQLLRIGCNPNNVSLFIEEGGIHYETSWAKRFPVMCKALLNDAP